VGTTQIFIACVAIWGSTWLAIKFQLGVVAPEVSVFYRYLIASSVVFAYCAARRFPLRFAPREHLWMALLGALTFSVSYLFVYYAEAHVVSGLVAVGYSASPLLSMLGMRAFFGTPMTRILATGSLLGIVGISLVFASEFAKLGTDADTAWGAFFTALAVIVSTLGNMVAHRNSTRGLPMWPSIAWGMLYGAALSLAVALLSGRPLAFEATFPYVASLLYLAIMGSVVAFGGFFTLMLRVGPARAGYIGVMVPIMALVISSFFEGFHFHALTIAGIAVSVVGNVVILRGRESESNAKDAKI
jgi:drug/metabolite transporter (DMT)-like permease